MRSTRPGSRSSGRPPPRPGSRRARRSATRSPRRPACRWRASGAFDSAAEAGAFARRAGRRGPRDRRQGRRPRRRQGRDGVATRSRRRSRRSRRPPGPAWSWSRSGSRGARRASSPCATAATRWPCPHRPRPQAPRRRRHAARTPAGWAPTARCRTSPTPRPTTSSARFHRPILAELARRGTPFRGALYAGLMLTADGPVLLECNARFGDPETQVILPRLAAPLGPLLLAAARGRLLEAARPLGLEGARLPALPIAAVGIVLAAAGYPEPPRRGDPIDGPGPGPRRRGARVPRRDRGRRRRRLPDGRRPDRDRRRAGPGPRRAPGRRRRRPPT